MSVEIGRLRPEENANRLLPASEDGATVLSNGGDERRRIIMTQARQAGNVTVPEIAVAGVHRPLTVVTPSVPAARVLATLSQVTVLLLGGKLRSRTISTAGSWITGILSRLVLDLPYLGAEGISGDRGLTVMEPAACAVKARAAAARVFTGVHTRFGSHSLSRFAEVSDFDTLITDAGPSAHDARLYTLAGPQVIRV